MAEAAFAPAAVVHSTMNVRGLAFHVTSKVTATQIDIELLALDPLRLVRCTLSRIAPGQWRLTTPIEYKCHPLPMNWFTPDEQAALIDIAGDMDPDFEPIIGDGVMQIHDCVIGDGTTALHDRVVFAKKMSLRENLERATRLQGAK
jgi:hypothetical protein